VNNSAKNVAKSVLIITNNDDPFAEVNDDFLEKDLKRTTIQRAQVKSSYLIFLCNLFSLGPIGTFCDPLLLVNLSRT